MCSHIGNERAGASVFLPVSRRIISTSPPHTCSHFNMHKWDVFSGHGGDGLMAGL